MLISTLTTQQVLSVIELNLGLTACQVEARNNIFKTLYIFDRVIVKNSEEGAVVDWLINKVADINIVSNKGLIRIDTNSINDGNNCYDEYLTFDFSNGLVIKKFNTSYIQEGLVIEQNTPEFTEAFTDLISILTINRGNVDNEFKVMSLVLKAVKAGKA